MFYPLGYLRLNFSTDPPSCVNSSVVLQVWEYNPPMRRTPCADLQLVWKYLWYKSWWLSLHSPSLRVRHCFWQWTCPHPPHTTSSPSWSWSRVRPYLTSVDGSSHWSPVSRFRYSTRLCPPLPPATTISEHFDKLLKVLKIYSNMTSCGGCCGSTLWSGRALSIDTMTSSTQAFKCILNLETVLLWVCSGVLYIVAGWTISQSFSVETEPWSLLIPGSSTGEPGLTLETLTTLSLRQTLGPWPAGVAKVNAAPGPGRRQVHERR